MCDFLPFFSLAAIGLLPFQFFELSRITVFTASELSMASRSYMAPQKPHLSVRIVRDAANGVEDHRSSVPARVGRPGRDRHVVRFTVPGKGDPGRRNTHGQFTRPR